MKKGLSYYLDLDYTIRLKKDVDQSFFAEIEELPGCFTEADSEAEALAMIEDAKKAWIRAALEQNQVIPEPVMENYSGKLHIRMPKSLHRTLAYRAKQEGVSLNSLITSRLASV